MAFTRRERALIAIANVRSFSHHLYMAHCFWDWSENGGRAGAAKNGFDWLEHCDAVLAQLIGIGDELSRFLTLPTPSRTRHRMTHHGRKEAARTMEVAYLLLESMNTQRLGRLILYSERLKKIGLPSGEVSRMRQYERFISDSIEQLKMIKLYRTPQALRSFGRIFTVILPPFYSPTYAQLAIDTNSLGYGVAFGVLTAICLTALFESVQVLEDPFTAFLALDGIDVREEFEVLSFAQLINTRKMAFPDAPPYPAGRRAALTNAPLASADKKRLIGLPPVQMHHERYRSGIPSLVDLTDLLPRDDLTQAGFEPASTAATSVGEKDRLTLVDDNEEDQEEEQTDRTFFLETFDAINDDHADQELGTVIGGGGGTGGDDDASITARETAFNEDNDSLIGTTPRTHTRSRTLSVGGTGLSRRRLWETSAPTNN